MKSLTPPDSHHLLAAQGWLELGDYLEADAELESISPRNRIHPDVLEIRWRIYSSAKKWSACLDIASTLLMLAPERSFGWIHRSFALHELNRTQEAFDKLVLAAKEFPNEWQFPYNLACYCSQLGRLEDAKEWLKKAILIDEEPVENAGIDDPDLKPLWNSMSRTIRKRTK